jgi:zinc protease
MTAIAHFLLAAAAAFASAADLPIQRFTLDNGLTVVVYEDHFAPIVAVNLWYKVGSFDERAGNPGNTGFAHLFEHYMFEGSDNVPTGEHFKRIFSMGGVTNASTSWDRTDYVESLPAEGLSEVLRLESDRLKSLKNRINQASLEKQQGIVINELKWRGDQPYAQAVEKLLELIFGPAGSHYAWGPGGAIADVSSAKLDDVRRFHATYYVPNNAVLVLAGDVDVAKARRLAEGWFKDIPAGPEPPRVEAPEYRQLGGRREAVLRDPKARLVRFYFGFPVPAKGQPGWAEADVLASLLTDGRNSRLTKSLVYDQALALGVGGGTIGLHHKTDVFILVVTPVPGVALERIEAAVNSELAKLVGGGFSQAELDRVKAKRATDRIDALQHADSVASQLAEGQAIYGNPKATFELDERVDSMLVEEPRKAAEDYLGPDNRAVVTVLPGAPDGAIQ